MAEAKNENMGKKSKECRNSIDKMKILIGVFIGLIVVSFLFYMCYFCGGVTSDHKRWAEFGAYIAGVAGMLNVIAFVVLTVSLHHIESEREENSKELEKERKNNSIRLHAEEVVVRKIQSELKEYIKYYLLYQKDQSKETASETFHFLQPFMTYLFYLNESEIILEETKKQIREMHEYLFEASDTIFAYAYDVIDDKKRLQHMIKVLEVYRLIYQKWEKLEVQMISDISKLSVQEEDSNYVAKNKKEDEIVSKSKEN